MKQTLVFIKQFFKTPKSVGSLVPSSKYLAEVITQNLTSHNEHSNIIELGPGTGAITEYILKKMPKNSCYTGIEVSKEFQQLLRERFIGIHIINGSARNINVHLKDLQGLVDVIISSLPFTNIEEKNAVHILRGSYDSLRKGGEFRMFLYLHTMYLPKNRRFLDMAKKIFKLKDRKLVFNNFPPAIVYTFTK